MKKENQLDNSRLDDQLDKCDPALKIAFLRLNEAVGLVAIFNKENNQFRKTDILVLAHIVSSLATGLAIVQDIIIRKRDHRAVGD